jgi:cytochrome c5
MKFGASDWIVPGVAAAALLVLSTAVASSRSLAAPASPPPATNAAAPGKAVFEDQCGTCHDLAVSTDLRKSRDEWQATVNRMLTSGASLTDDEVAKVVDYLTKNYGAT